MVTTTNGMRRTPIEVHLFDGRVSSGESREKALAMH
jgi:hypothetical protein